VLYRKKTTLYNTVDGKAHIIMIAIHAAFCPFVTWSFHRWKYLQWLPVWQVCWISSTAGVAGHEKTWKTCSRGTVYL